METSPQSDTCLLHDFQGQSIWIVTTEIHCFYTSIDNHLGTRSTRLMSAVEAGPSDIRALVCRLDNGILLRVQPPTEFVPLPRGNSHCRPQPTTLRTVLQSPRRSVISGGQNLPITYQNRSPPSAFTGGSPRENLRNLHEVAMPARAHYPSPDSIRSVFRKPSNQVARPELSGKASVSSRERSRSPLERCSVGSLVRISTIIRPTSRISVSYTHLRAHETKANLVCRLLLEKKKKKKKKKKYNKKKKKNTNKKTINKE